MRDTVLCPQALLTPSGLREGWDVHILGDEIAEVRPRQGQSGGGTRQLPGLTLAPGFVDLHVQGCLGTDVWDETEGSLERLSLNLARFGTTGFLGTTTYDRDTVDRLANACRSRLPGAQMLGIHLEGPFISPQRRGAIPEEGLLLPDPEALTTILDACQGFLRIMTIAPELPGARAVVERLVREGVIASLGHTKATFEQAEESFRWGITHATHLFNAMDPFHHRAPGPAVACALARQVTVEAIPDGIHLHPGTLRLLFQLKAPSQVTIVTDAVRPAGMSDGEYTSGKHGPRVRLRSGQVSLPDGTLAGSALTMDQAVRSAMDLAGLSLQEAIRSSVCTPLACLGQDVPPGIVPGAKADLVAIDRQGRARACLVHGHFIYDDLSTDIGPDEEASG